MLPVGGDVPAGFASRAMGLRLAGAVDGGWGGGGSLYERAVGLLMGPVISARYFDELWIGGDSRGFSANFSMQMAVGARLRLAPDHGPFARLSVRGKWQQQFGSRYRMLRLPGLQLGWGGVRGDWQWEILGHVSPSLAGKVRLRGIGTGVDETELYPRGLAAGGAFTWAYERVRWDADVSLLNVRGHRAPLWDARSHLCSHFGKKRPDKPLALSAYREIVYAGPRAAEYSLGVCLDGQYLAIPALAGAPSRAPGQVAFGVSIVLGRFSGLDPLP